LLLGQGVVVETRDSFSFHKKLLLSQVLQRVAADEHLDKELDAERANRYLLLSRQEVMVVETNLTGNLLLLDQWFANLLGT
jgi:hypothetical protein